ncbi:hypothetical protein O1611_g9083 [Lasiodiplodia mahajangana]|uniref:Uncharacterized protein n=1 Tax=Lasiodiplodia mahajangana TaxID=1108764 RepID=A0ACC2JAV1_9PEZI|nr:hypothetical protein O1611_g9083 [Lasiodiplodia mahajangana]
MYHLAGCLLRRFVAPFGDFEVVLRSGLDVLLEENWCGCGSPHPPQQVMVSYGLDTAIEGEKKLKKLLIACGRDSPEMESKPAHRSTPRSENQRMQPYVTWRGGIWFARGT